jgi:hypothetical protein
MTLQPVSSPVDYGAVAPAVLAGWAAQLVVDAGWAGLFSVDPMAVPNPLAVEAIGATYVRVRVTWARNQSVLSQANVWTWTGLSVGTQYVAVGLFPTATNGTLSARLLFPEPVVVTPGGQISLPVGSAQLVVGA